MTASYQTLELEHPHEHVLLVRLNRQHVCNAINSQMMAELYKLWLEVKSLPVRCIILTGAGDKAFCAGADLKERHDLNVTTWKKQHKQLQAAMLAMSECAVPIIAAINGVAYGGGLELALACDFIYAHKDTTFALPEVSLGIMPGAMGTQNLPWACGMRRAKEIILAGQPFSSEQAYQWGIVNQLCSADQLLPDVLETALRISDNAPLSVVHAKTSINHAVHKDITADFKFEIDQYNPLLKTHDRVEGVNAFNEKRKPEFKGE